MFLDCEIKFSTFHLFGVENFIFLKIPFSLKNFWATTISLDFLLDIIFQIKTNEVVVFVCFDHKIESTDFIASRLDEQKLPYYCTS